MKTCAVVFCVLVGVASAAVLPIQFQAPPPGVIQFGVDANGCTVGPSGKTCPGSGPVQFTSEAKGVAPPPPPPSAHQPAPQHHQQAHHHHHHQFTGLVGPSGNIGPSGLVGPSGPVHFGAHFG